MKYDVTDIAGFIGNHLAEHLLGLGEQVLTIDYFTPHYSRSTKLRNLCVLAESDGLELRELDPRSDGVEEVLKSGDVVCHLAALPGIRAS